MKQPIQNSVFATVKMGRIASPKNISAGDPRATVIRTDEGDLRSKRTGGKRK